MSVLRSLRAGLRFILHRSVVDHELDEELAHYVDAAVHEKVVGGLSPAEARRAVRLEIGGIDAVKETVRASGWEASLDTLWRDLRYAARSLAKTPSFTITAILTLAFGVGGNTAMFSVVNAVVLQPLPFADPDRLATLWTDDPRHGSKDEGTSNITFLDWRTRSHSFTDMAVVSCSRSPASTSPTCSSPAVRCAATRWPSARHSARVVGASCDNCSPRAHC
jgi:hypothetical protein